MTNIIEISLAVALEAYRGQVDKAGEPYILHPMRVMAKMDTNEERAVALLHDVIEDSDYTADMLLDAGIPQAAVQAVEALTKLDGETYEGFIERLKGNPLASRVKVADIEDNINVLRLDEVTEKDLNRVEKYHRAWKKLQEN
jgi:hypothetical protein